MDDNKKFLGRKDKGKKLLQDALCTVGREEMKQSKLKENLTREKKWESLNWKTFKCASIYTS